jgi:release factor glutamine methyltransferase
MKRETIDTLRERHRQEALSRGISARDVDVLLADITGKSIAWLVAHGEERIDPGPLTNMLARRYAGEPLQYIRGRTEFYSREFLVDSRVLIPRPETEILVETALANLPRSARVIDVGTGSGCIAITIERERPDLHVFAIDLSPEALAVADINRRRHGSKVRLAASDVLDAVRGEFDLVVSNPPYIALPEVPALEPHVRDYEPHIALSPGPRGTETIERIFRAAQNARVILEIGYGQENAVRGVAEALNFEIDRVISDLAGIPRIVVSSPRNG